MILAFIQSIQSDINMVLTLFGCFVGLALALVFLVMRLAWRSVRDGYRKDGGAKGLARKVATKGAAALVRRLIFKKW